MQSRTNSHIMGFFALLLLITVVAISVDRLKQSQDTRKEASVVCPQEMPICEDGSLGTRAADCTPICGAPGNLASTVSLQPVSPGPYYLYNFYNYEVDPPTVDNIRYKVNFSSPRSRDAIQLTFAIPDSAEIDDIGFTANVGISVVKTQDILLGNVREITLSFSGIAALWTNAETPIDLGVFRARPTKLGEFIAQLPQAKNPFVSIRAGSQAIPLNILPSLELSMVLEPGDDTYYVLSYSVKNVNPIRDVYMGLVSLELKKSSGTSLILDSTGILGLVHSNESVPFSIRISRLLEVGDELIVHFKPSTTEINALPETGILRITPALLNQLHAQIFYDLTLEGSIASSVNPNFPVEYELEIHNASQVPAKNVVLDISSSQLGVTVVPALTGFLQSLCKRTGLPVAVTLRCTFAEIGVVPPLLFHALGVQPGNVSLHHTLTVLGNPERETNTANNSLVLTTVMNQPTPATFRTADIWPVGNPDRKVDISDYAELARHFNERGAAGWIPADIQPDGWIDLSDYSILVNQFSPTGYN